jgi:hypothetical protein
MAQLIRSWTPQHLFDILGFQGDGALGAHQRFTWLLSWECMLGIAFRALKNVCSFFTAKTAFASHLRCVGFVFGHEIFLLKLRFGY